MVRVTRTYLELNSVDAFRPAFGSFPGVTIERVAGPTAALYRHCYRTVGDQWHWRDRWDWTDDEIVRHLARPEITLYVARREAELLGWYELRRVPEDDSVEIAYFGLVPAAIGQGLGRHLLSCAVRDAWAAGPRRVWLHTCTLDHPAAVPNYVARGFAPYSTEEYEVDSPA
jgi:GNAT superfamily N-acetyltransferase